MGNEPAVQSNGELALDRMAQFHAYMLDRAQTETRPDDIADQISASNMEAIFSAETEDGIWSAGTGGTVQGRDAIGLEMEIRGFRAVRSTRQDIEGRGYYITADATCLGGPEDTLRKLGIGPGEDFAFQTGADDIVYRLRAFELRDLFPVKAMVGGVTTQSGQTVLKLRPQPKRARPGTTA